MKKIFSLLRTGLLGVFLLIICGASLRANAEVIDVPLEVTFNQTEARKEFEMINSFRTGSDAWYWNSDNTSKTVLNNLSELNYDYNLEKVAMQRAVEIALYYSHDRADGSDCWKTYSDLNYNAYSAGENIAYGYRSAESVFEAWQEKEDDYYGQGHRRNMLASGFNVCGFACVYYKGIYYWVQEFAYSYSDSLTYTAPDDSTRVCYAKAYTEDTPFCISPVSLKNGDSIDLEDITIYVDYIANGSHNNKPISVTPTYSVADTSVAQISGNTLKAQKSASETELIAKFKIKGVEYSAKGKISVEGSDQTFKYVMNSDGTIMITGLVAGYSLYGSEKFVIPSELDGKKVTAIGESAFSGVNFGENCIVYISDGIVNLEPKAFYSAYMKKVVIPKSTKSFGTFDYVFSYLRAEEIEVDSNNPYLTSREGILFTKDLKICYACPTRKKERMVELPLETEMLCCTSFGNSSVRYLYFLNPNGTYNTYTFYNCDMTIYGTKSCVEAWQEKWDYLTSTRYISNNVKFEVYDSSKKPILSTGITLNKNNVEIDEGDQVQLKATLTPSNTTEKNIKWYSDSSYVASVDQNGLVTANRAGVTTITAMAEDSGVIATCNVRVLWPTIPIESISLSDTSIKCKENDEFTLSLTRYPNNTTDNNTVSWTIKDEDGKTIAYWTKKPNGSSSGSSSGGTVYFTSYSLNEATFKAVKTGKATIIVTVGDKTAECSVTVGDDNQGQTSDLQEEQVKAFVTRFYTLILNREPDETGINYWTQILLNKEQTGAQVAYGFVNSPEFTEEHPVNDTEFVKRMYAAFFDRDGGSDGEAWWLGYLNQGYTRNYVLAGFTNSDEFKDLCAQYGIDQGSLPMDESMKTNPNPSPQPHVDGLNIDASNVDPAKLDEYIDRLYRLVLKREPEAEGKQYWREEIIKGNPYNASTAAEIGFFNSPEYLAMNKTDEEFIMDCYLVFLNREAEESGFEYWKEKFRTGEYDRQKLIEVGVGHSNEFKDILRSYGFVIIE